MKAIVAAAVVCFVSLGGCVTLSQEAAGVQVHSQVSGLLDGCTKLGPVTASTSAFQLSSESALEAALREETAKMGGDSVATVRYYDHMTSYSVQAVAFRCF